MRKVWVSLLVAIVAAPGAYASEGKEIMLLDLAVPESRATKVEWFYSGVTNIVESLYRCYTPIRLDDLLPFVDYLIEKDAKVSLDELVDVCMNVSNKRAERLGQDEELLAPVKQDVPRCENVNLIIDPQAASATSGLEQVSALHQAYTGLDSFCSTFVSNMIFEQAAVVNDYAHRKKKKIFDYPGTYVRKYSDGIYKIEEVILADGYKKSGVLNDKVNTARENTKVYEILPDGTFKDLNVYTYTNDMFLNTMATDNVRGIYNSSFICMNVDVTDDITQMFNNRRGEVGYTVESGIRLLPDDKKGDVAGGFIGYLGFLGGDYTSSGVKGVKIAGTYDTKRTLSSKCKVEGQSASAVAVNGVWYNGKIANLEWLGHYLYGMIRDEGALLNSESVDWLRAKVQQLSNSGGADDENQPHKLAADMGTEYRRSVDIDRRFESTQFANPKDALNTVKGLVVKKWANFGATISNVRCCNNCNKTGQDVVWCDYKQHHMEFVIDDVANDVFVNCYKDCL